MHTASTIQGHIDSAVIWHTYDLFHLLVVRRRSGGMPKIAQKLNHDMECHIYNCEVVYCKCQARSSPTYLKKNATVSRKICVVSDSLFGFFFKCKIEMITS